MILWKRLLRLIEQNLYRISNKNYLQIHKLLHQSRWIELQKYYMKYVCIEILFIAKNQSLNLWPYLLFCLNIVNNRNHGGYLTFSVMSRTKKLRYIVNIKYLLLKLLQQSHQLKTLFKTLHKRLLFSKNFHLHCYFNKGTMYLHNTFRHVILHNTAILYLLLPTISNYENKHAIK